MAGWPRRGEVWWATAGSKVRPVLVISSDAMNRRLPKALVVPGTTDVRRWPDEVVLELPFLPRPTAFCCRELTPVPIGVLQTVAGPVEGEVLAQVCATMGAVLGCRWAG